MVRGSEDNIHPICKQFCCLMEQIEVKMDGKDWGCQERFLFCFFRKRVFILSCFNVGDVTLGRIRCC